MDMALDILLDAVKDTLYIAVFLFVTYLVMEWIEHKTSQRTTDSIRRAGKAGPFIGAVLGAIPQCGFSAAASTLYAGRVVTLGTLFAVYLSTSDEMLPIFLAERVPLGTIGAVLLTKIAVGMVLGFVVDAVMRACHREPQSFAIDELCEAADCACDEHCADEAEAHHADGHDHHDYHEHHEHGHGSIVASAFKHTLQVIIFVFIITLVLGAILEGPGEGAFAEVLAGAPVISILLSCLVGLIPNCAASIAIAELYVEGILGAGAMLGGLLVGAGVGLLVLFRTNRHMKENVLIVVALYAMGVVCGLIVYATGLVF